MPAPKSHRIRLSDGRDIEYVDWLDEPHHHNLFENAHTRVYAADLPPGVHTLYHRHKEDTVYVCLDDGGPAGVWRWFW